MKSHHLFNLIVVAILLVVVGLTIREAAATTTVISQAAATSPSSAACASLPSRYSIRSEYVQAMGSWVIVHGRRSHRFGWRVDPINVRLSNLYKIRRISHESVLLRIKKQGKDK
jgi:hypothetical protein